MVISRSTGSPSLNLPKDPGFSNTVLLIHGDGTSGANNTMFLENSGSETFIPFKGTYSNYFNGTSDYLTVTGSGSFSLASTDFTIEAWIYPTLTNSSFAIVGKDWTSGTTYPSFAAYMISGGTIRLTIGSGTSSPTGAQDITSTTAVIANSWSHIAIVKSGSTYTWYINGAAAGTASSTGTIGVSSGTVKIGAADNPSTYFPGYISNLRIVKQALYTGAFTPSTTPLTTTSQGATSAQLLACQSSTFKDNGTSNYTITSTGTPAISSGGPAVVPFGKPGQGVFSPYNSGWSNYFNGTTDVLTTSESNLNFISSQFTIEAWVYYSGVTASAGGAGILISQDDGSSGSQNFQLGILATTNYLRFLWFTTSSRASATSISSSTGLPTNSWNHVAVTWDETTLRLFINGVLANSTTSFSPFNSAGTLTSIGNFTTVNSGAGVTGYISNARIIKGNALYTSNFTPPIASLTAISNTALLTCANNRFTASNTTVSNVAITTTGLPQVQPFSPFSPTTAYSKNRVGGSVYFNGSSDYLTVPAGNTFNYGTGNFTLEAWIYTGSASTQRIVSINNTFEFLLFVNGSNVWLDFYDGVADRGSSSYNVPFNSWVHVAAVRNSGVLNLYINGVLSNASPTVTTNLNAGATNTGYIGRYSLSAINYFNGYISNLRSLVGTALYTSNFTPSTAPLTPVANTTLLVNSTNAGIIDQTGKNNLATYGSATVSSTQSKFGGSSIFFNGTTDYIATPYINSKYYDWATTGAYTIEAWIYPTSFANYKPIISNSLIGGGSNWELVLNNSGQVVWRYWTGSAQTYTTTSALTLNAWNHVALVLSGGNIIIYINGVSGVSSAYVATAAAGGGTDGTFIYIGAAYGGITGAATNYFTGYIDDLRITRGIARYTANFNPPARKFEDR